MEILTEEYVNLHYPGRINWIKANLPFLSQEQVLQVASFIEHSCKTCFASIGHGYNRCQCYNDE